MINDKAHIRIIWGVNIILGGIGAIALLGIGRNIIENNEVIVPRGNAATVFQAVALNLIDADKKPHMGVEFPRVELHDGSSVTIDVTNADGTHTVVKQDYPKIPVSNVPTHVPD